MKPSQKKSVAQATAKQHGPPPERVQKLIAAAGLCSRREAEDWIRAGDVIVNGSVIAIGASARRGDTIFAKGIRVVFPTLRYYALHKPAGYVTAVRDYSGQQTVLDLVPSEDRVYPVGRLDKDTTGLLLLTNDGEFANRVMHPRYGLEKTYLATLDRPFDRSDIPRFSQGIALREGIVRASVRVLSPRRVSVKIHQGYHHVVKRIFGERSYRVKDLVRTHVGPLKVDIPLGAYRPLKQEEIDRIYELATPRPPPPLSSRAIREKQRFERLRERSAAEERERARTHAPTRSRRDAPVRSDRSRASERVQMNRGPAPLRDDRPSRAPATPLRRKASPPPRKRSSPRPNRSGSRTRRD
jgi:23S rRNA pseudouridine2605 synthase